MMDNDDNTRFQLHFDVHLDECVINEGMQGSNGVNLFIPKYHFIGFHLLVGWFIYLWLSNSAIVFVCVGVCCCMFMCGRFIRNSTLLTTRHSTINTKWKHVDQIVPKQRVICGGCGNDKELYKSALFHD